MDKQPQLLDETFSDACLQGTFQLFNLGHILLVLSKSKKERHPYAAIFAVAAIMFSINLGRNESRKNFKHSSVGKCFSAFLFGIVASMVRSVQQNCLGSFKSLEFSSIGDTEADRKLKQPTWVKPFFIKLKHLEIAREKMRRLAIRKFKRL